MTVVRIEVAATDITADVEFAQTNFTMRANGTPGNLTIRVKDTTHKYSFVAGSLVQCFLDDVLAFTGFLLRIRRGFAFTVADTSAAKLGDLIWTLEGTDVNILWSKRVTYNKAHPEQYPLPSPSEHSATVNGYDYWWAEGSPGDVVVDYNLTHYTDLGELCTWDSSSIQNVGSPNPDQTAYYNGGLTVAELMQIINRVPMGVYYIDPSFKVFWVDVDTPTTDYVLTDNPTASNHIGYRELTHNSNGSNLANEAMEWGSAMGDPTMGFARAYDDASAVRHGLWQWGEYRQNISKPDALQRRADSVVYGSAENKRGHKDDQVSFTCTIFDNPGMALQVGTKVQIESQVFSTGGEDISDVVPIRAMTISFPTKSDPQYVLTLSHEIDEPWSMFQSFWGDTFNPYFPRIPRIDYSLPHWYDYFHRTLSAGTWGDPDHFPPSGYSYSFLPAGEGYGSAPTGTWLRPTEDDDSLGGASVSDGVATMDAEAMLAAGMHSWPGMGVVFDDAFTYPFEYLWRNVTVTAPTNPEWWIWRVLLQYAWGVHEADYAEYPYIVFAMYVATDSSAVMAVADWDRCDWFDDSARVPTNMGAPEEWIGVPINLRARVDELGLHMRAWKSSEGEPALWTNSCPWKPAFLPEVTISNLAKQDYAPRAIAIEDLTGTSGFITTLSPWPITHAHSETVSGEAKSYVLPGDSTHWTPDVSISLHPSVIVPTTVDVTYSLSAFGYCYGDVTIKYEDGTPIAYNPFSWPPPEGDDIAAYLAAGGHPPGDGLPYGLAFEYDPSHGSIVISTHRADFTDTGIPYGPVMTPVGWFEGWMGNTIGLGHIEWVWISLYESDFLTLDASATWTAPSPPPVWPEPLPPGSAQGVLTLEKVDILDGGPWIGLSASAWYTDDEAIYGDTLDLGVAVIPASVQLWDNGIFQMQGRDYTVTSAGLITFGDFGEHNVYVRFNHGGWE
jgi:hypothetical protein